VCGVVAVAVAAGEAVDDERARDAVAALAHRGPDGRGAWRSADGAVWLGHARLAVIDPAGGAQPIANEDGSIVAVVNGELYGHGEHARWLEARGHRLRGRCDAEVLVHLYEELGDDLVRRVRGELAFALWDGRRRRLVAGRDRFGVKPLVWARWRGGVALASEAKALFALGVPARWDDEAFFHAAQAQYVWPDRTLFQGVRQIAPGTILVWDGGAPRTARYWELPVGAAVAAATEADAAARLGEALDDAVRVRLAADARVCVQLSGGVDSTSVAALAARAGGVGAAFTVAWTGTAAAAYDEREIAAATARELGLSHHVVEIDGAAIAASWPAAVAHGEGLAINGHLVGKWLLSRAMQGAGYKVALTGEGADELLAGYPHLRADAGAATPGHAASRGVMLPAAGDAGLATDGVRARLGYVPTWIAAKAGLGRRVRELLAPELVRRFAGADPLAELVARGGGERLRGAPRLHASAATWIGGALAQYILRTLGDGMEMAHGIEGRVPFLDHRVAEVAFAIEPRVLAGDGLDKPVLRRAMRGLLPAAVAARPKHPFLAPPLARIAPALVQDTLRAHARRSRLIDGRRLVEVLDAIPAMGEVELQAWDAALMLILSAAILEARYGA
jgi:asparagine synthase (glutamine-hydrolysing)